MECFTDSMARGYTRPTHASMLKSWPLSGLDAEDALQELDRTNMKDMRAAQEALADELTRTRSQATLRTRALRDENERLKLQLATQRERAIGLQTRLDSTRRGGQGAAARMAHDLAEIQQRLLEEHGRLKVAQGEAETLRDKAARARARLSSELADRHAVDQLLQDEKAAHARTCSELDGERDARSRLEASTGPMEQVPELLAKAEASAASSSSRVKQLEAELDHSHMRMQRLERETKALLKEVQHAATRDAAHAELAQHYKRLQANHTGLSAATEDACSQMQKADAALRLRESENRDLKDRLAAAEAAADNAQSRAVHLERKLAAANDEAAELRSHNEELLDKAYGAQPLSPHRSAESVRAAEQAGIIERQKLQLESREAEIRELEGALAAARAECTASHAAAASDRQAVRSVQLAHQAAAQEASSLRAGLNAAEARAKQALAKADAAVRERSAAESRQVAALQSDLASQAAAHARALQSKSKAFAAFQANQASASASQRSVFGQSAAFNSAASLKPAPLSSRARHAAATQPSEAATQASKLQQRYSLLTKETDSVLAAYPAPKLASEWSIPSSSSALDRRKWMDRLGWVASM